MTYYLVRIGEGSKYAKEAKKGGFVAVGWNEVPNLVELGTLAKIRSSLSRGPRDYTPTQIAMQAGQLYRFGLEMVQSDIVVSPLGGGEYLVGEVGNYYFDNSPKDDCPYKHRREVNWYDRLIQKEDMSTNLVYSVGAIMTIFSLDKYADELEALIAGEPYTPAEKPQRVRDLILSGLMDLGGKEFEEFVGHLLELIGFTAEVTRYIGDKGIDVNGMLDAEGLASITLRVQVERARSAVGNREVLALRGALRQGEQGCLITLSTFTPRAIEEAQMTGKIPIKLIDGNDLAGIALRHFDEIDDEYKRKFGIRRKKDFNIEDQFEAIEGNLAAIEPQPGVPGESLPRWDTLVCAAKEDGFKGAFLGQKAWWAIRLNPDSIPHIKYIAMYQVAPISRITYYGKVDRIEPYRDTGKYKLYLEGSPIKLRKPVGLGKNPHLKPQGPKYATLKNILSANSLDDVFGREK